MDSSEVFFHAWATIEAVWGLFRVADFLLVPFGLASLSVSETCVCWEMKAVSPSKLASKSSAIMLKASKKPYTKCLNKPIAPAFLLQAQIWYKFDGLPYWFRHWHYAILCHDLGSSLWYSIFHLYSKYSYQSILPIQIAVKGHTYNVHAKDVILPLQVRVLCVLKLQSWDGPGPTLKLMLLSPATLHWAKIISTVIGSSSPPGCTNPTSLQRRWNCREFILKDSKLTLVIDPAPITCAFP